MKEPMMMNLDPSDADEIVKTMLEAADRVKSINAVVPGAEAHWVFELDDTRFRVTVRVHEQQPDDLRSAG